MRCSPPAMCALLHMAAPRRGAGIWSAGHEHTSAQTAWPAAPGFFAGS
jgi:hypothetical protein